MQKNRARRARKRAMDMCVGGVVKRIGEKAGCIEVKR